MRRFWIVLSDALWFLSDALEWCADAVWGLLMECSCGVMNASMRCAAKGSEPVERATFDGPYYSVMTNGDVYKRGERIKFSDRSI